MAKRRANGTPIGDLVHQDPPQLSCELCRERKVKCDKLLPCTNCVSSGVNCIPTHRLRLPRGRHVQRIGQACPPQFGAQATASLRVPVNDGLSERLRRLETLVDSMGSAGARSNAQNGQLRQQSFPDSGALAPAPGHGTSRTSSNHATSEPSKKQGGLLHGPNEFWANLVEEVHGLRNVIESAPDEADEGDLQAPESSKLALVDGGMKLLGVTVTSSLGYSQMDARLQRMGFANQLCQVYLEQVDPIIKILHRPSLSKWLLQGEGYLGRADGDPSMEALRSAVYYSAVSSMTERQVHEMFRSSKSIVIAQCRSTCEAEIEKSGLLTTEDIIVLQAFVLYLVARKAEDRSRAVWTLAALIVRIARALCLDKEPVQSETFFDQQTRKRLWMTICLMDIQSSFGRDSEPLIHINEATSLTMIPANINDSDFDPTTTDGVFDKEELTDMTFALVIYHLQVCTRMTSFALHGRQEDGNIGGSDGSASIAETTRTHSSNATLELERRLHYARQFQQQALQLLHFCDPESSTYAWCTFHGTHNLVSTAKISALRPLRRARRGVQAPAPRVDGDQELLHLSVQALEKVELLHTDPRGERFRWYVAYQWHALAIAIAECYICTDVTILRQVWPLVEASYSHREAVFERTSGGKPLGPLSKLMRGTRGKVASLLRDDSDASGSGGLGFVSDHVQASDQSHRSGILMGQMPADSTGVASFLTPSLGWAHELGDPSSAAPLAQQVCDSASPTLDAQLTLDVGTSSPSLRHNETMTNFPWNTWEELMLDIPLESTFFDEAIFGAG